jgi:hypothetical protein
MTLQNWADAITKRLRKHTPPDERDYVTAAPRLEALEILSHIGPQPCMAILKTWMCSWATTERFKEADRLPCIFGCTDAPDTIAHYFRCVTMWDFFTEALHIALPNQPMLFLARLGIAPPCIALQVLTSFTFSVYHDLKIGHRKLINQAVTTGDRSLLDLQIRSSIHLASIPGRWGLSKTHYNYFTNLRIRASPDAADAHSDEHVSSDPPMAPRVSAAP